MLHGCIKARPAARKDIKQMKFPKLITDSSNWFLNLLICIMLAFALLSITLVYQCMEIKDLQKQVRYLAKRTSQEQIEDLQKEDISQNIQIEMLWDAFVSGEIPTYYTEEVPIYHSEKGDQ